MEFFDISFSFLKANLNIFVIESFDLGNPLLVLILSLRLHLNHCLLGFSPEANLVIDHVLARLFGVTSVTVDFSIVFLYYHV